MRPDQPPPGPGVGRRRGRAVTVATTADLDRRLDQGARDLEGWVLHGLDLRGRGERLRRCRVRGALVLGCRLDEHEESSLRERGAVVLAQVPGSPLDVYRGELYTADELYDTVLDGGRYSHSLDGRAYAWSRAAADVRERSLAAALHDHAIEQALATWVEGRSLVGVMGGHAAGRGTPAYAEAARLGRLLGGRRTVATGGGPGAMEAANLGAWMSARPDAALDDAVARLASVPSFAPRVAPWARAGLEVRDAFPDGSESLGVPTWFYGHEPPGVFATAIAKLVGNAAREALLLQVCDAGIAFLPGAGGTVQEIFQDACENYYADDSSLARMVLVGVEHWTERLPAWPLLQALARGRPMESRVHLVDTVDEAAALLA